MRRRLFFWLDKLKITRTERQAISVLLIIFAVLLFMNAIISASSPFDDEYYSELDARFQMRTALMQQEDQQIMSRYRGESANISSTDTLAPDSTAGQVFAEIPEAALININSADPASLQQLRGIGAAYSQRIVEYRQQNGPFQSVSEVLNIKGIGEVRLRKISPFITLADGDETEIKTEVNVEDTEAGDQFKTQAEGRLNDEIDLKDNKHVIGGKEKIEAESNIRVKDKVEVKDEVASEATFIINVNKANAEALQQLSGIGPAYARRIVEYRQLNGPFETNEQLLDIKGIGEKRLAKIKPFIKLKEQH
jgi:comEA protein